MKKSFLVVSMFLSALIAFADENVLQTIQIEPIKDTYNIVLISDKAVDVKKEVEEDGSILLSMKGIRASEMLNTVYNGTSDIDSVLVTPKNNNEIEIRVKGDNVEHATVTFDSLTPPVAAKPSAKKEIILNKPMKSYEPVFSTDEEEEFAASSFPPLGQKIVNVLKSIYGNKTNRGIINFGLLGLILFAAIRLIRVRETDEMKVGLAQGLAEREINLYKPMQTPVANNFTSATEKPYTTLNYGLNAYRNVNKNPYETRRQGVNRVAAPEVNNTTGNSHGVSSALNQALNQIKPAANNMSRQNINPVATATADVDVAAKTAHVSRPQANIDNVKFLETMSAIYEKSGRHDLAQGIKANLSKVK